MNAETENLVIGYDCALAAARVTLARVTGRLRQIAGWDLELRTGAQKRNVRSQPSFAVLLLVAPSQCSFAVLLLAAPSQYSLAILLP